MRKLNERFYYILKKIYHPIKIFKYGYGIFDVANQNSYFPKKVRKKYIKRLFENFKWLIHYVTPNEFYNLYGFDITNFKNIRL